MLKGISPLVAVIMLIAFTLVVAGILAGWATQFAQEQQRGIQYCTDASAMILSGVFNDDSDNITLYVHNYGKVDLTFNTLLSYQNGSVKIHSGTTEIKAGDIGTIILSDNADFADISEITVQSERCPGAQDFLERRNIKDLD